MSIRTSTTDSYLLVDSLDGPQSTFHQKEKLDRWQGSAAANGDNDLIPTWSKKSTIRQEQDKSRNFPLTLRK